MFTVVVLMQDFVKSGWEIVFAILGDVTIIIALLWLAGKLPL